MVLSSRITSYTKHWIHPPRRVAGVQRYSKLAIKNIFYRQNSLYFLILMPSFSLPPMHYTIDLMHLLIRVCVCTITCCHLSDRVWGCANGGWASTSPSSDFQVWGWNSCMGQTRLCFTCCLKALPSALGCHQSLTSFLSISTWLKQYGMHSCVVRETLRSVPKNNCIK